MQTTKEAREARRRRILERGSDRLAFITGATTKPLHKEDPPTIAQKPESLLDLSDFSGLASKHADDPAASIGSHLPDLDPNSREVSESIQEMSTQSLTISSHQEMTETWNSSVTAQQTVSTRSSSFTAETSLSALNLTNSNSQSPAVSLSSGSMDRNSTPGNGGISAKKSPILNVRKLIQTIDESESLRAFLAMMIAVVVVLQTNLSSCGLLYAWLPGWPLSLVFVTDISIVIARLMLSSYPSNPNQMMNVAQEDGDADKLSKALNIMGQFEDIVNMGLIWKKAVGGISLDCSIYIVMVVCGLSLGQYLFPCKGV